MKLIHLSDLHLGKRVNEFPMIDDQAAVLDQILGIVQSERPDAVLIAGDVYDKPVPSTEAVRLFDDFLFRLSRMGVPACVISGNHDSAERIAFGGRLMDGSGIHLAPAYDGHVTPLRLEDAFGPVDIWMLPFIKPAHVRDAFPDAAVDSFTDAVHVAIAHMELDPAARNVLVTHLFVTGALRCDSEDVSVGGADNVDADVFAPFDYVALGHLHGPQSVGEPRIRYCGSPLKYSFSEAAQRKSATAVELGSKGRLDIREIPLQPVHDLREIRGTYDALTLKANYEGAATDDYLHAILTDETDVPDAMARLRVIYPNLIKLDYDNARARAAALAVEEAEIPEKRTEIELFEALYEAQNGRPMSGEQRRFSLSLFERIQEALP